MSSTDRQSRLLATEDWKTIYQSFRNADFQSYDFDNLRRTMINYLRQNYPEDFNDYIESTEYLALIDLIAFLGQNLSFRIDLNARENFLETAERRESILRLARLLSYNVTRNQSANGLLKIDTIKTTESVIDSTGLNLAGITIRWNDRSNSNYFEQFIKAMNAALPVNGAFGRPVTSDIIAGISTDIYRFNAVNTDVPIFPFTKNVEGVSTRFEIVSSNIENGNIVEEPPLPGNNPAFLYRDNGQGAGSNNTGFFMNFRQGRLDTGTFSVDNPTPNQTIAIDTVNINNTDVWLYNTDSNGFESSLWTKLEAVEGNNIIYNSLFKGVRNVYAVTSRIEDRINLVFSDGTFGNLPTGNFKIYYRTSANRNIIINPSALTNISIEIPYLSRSNTTETLTLGMSLKYSVSNGSTTESDQDIKTNAPATYYTQNRLITAEDYNIGPLGISQDIIKTKSVNRIASGISRYYDLKDPSGKYSNTSLFADDGVIYKEDFSNKTSFSFTTQSDIEGAIYNTIEPLLANTNTMNFYLEKYSQILVSDLNIDWRFVSSATNRSTGYFTDLDNVVIKIGSYTSSTLRLLEAGAMCKFTAPLDANGNKQYFKADGTYTTDATILGISEYTWSKIISVYGDGTQLQTTGAGPIVFNDYIPLGAKITQIIPKLSRVLIDDVKAQIIDRVFAYRDFALRYDQNSRQWKLIIAENINTINPFSTGKAGDVSGQNLDSSWMLYFKTDGETYTVTYRALRYIFESANEVRFFFDNADKIYDPKTGQLNKDKIYVLNINRQPDSLNPFTKDFTWSISDAYRDADGYVDSRKIQVQFFDRDDDGVLDDPELFNEIVDPTINLETKYIFQQKYLTSDGVEDFKYFDNLDSTILIKDNEDAIGSYSEYENDGQVFYLINEGVFKTINKTTVTSSITSDYKAYLGRSNLKFHYIHVADSNYRIDPGSSNIIDSYLLTKNYDTEFRKYLNGARSTKPLPPSADELYRSYGADIAKIKSISDEVIYHPVKYKMIFGNRASEDLQVTFKIVKNPGLTINNNELKANVIDSINKFFSIEFWNFGDTFYFQELSAYVMNNLSPELVSIVIVPKQASQSFGSLFEIKSESDEIFINAAQVSDVEIIDEITASNLQASGIVITSVLNMSSTGIQSATNGGY
mgnify:CR=1 FL=1|tara:strand:+ start:7196 stop:10645 length:3450 start_codon:yes stop_codon:yes gene_type:complete